MEQLEGDCCCPCIMHVLCSAVGCVSCYASGYRTRVRAKYNLVVRLLRLSSLEFLFFLPLTLFRSSVFDSFSFSSKQAACSESGLTTSIEVQARGEAFRSRLPPRTSFAYSIFNCHCLPYIAVGCSFCDASSLSVRLGPD